MLADRVATRREVIRSADPVTMREFDRLLANGNSSTSKSGVSVSAQRALGISAWYSGVRYLSETVAGLPFHRYSETAGQRSRRADAPWKEQPDVEQPWYGLVEMWMMSLLHKGNSYNFKLRNPAGQVVGMRELHPDRVTGGQAPDGTKRFAVDRSEMLYSSRDIFHIPGLTYDGRFGLNPIQYGSDVLGATAATDDYAGYFFSSNTHVGGIISVAHAMSKDEAASLSAEWDDFHKGLLNSHRTGVLSKGAEYKRVSLDAASTQLLESRQYGVTEVARLLRLPPHKLYDLSRATFSNIEHQSIEAITDGVQPWCERIEAHVNFDRDLTTLGTFSEFQLEGRLRGDTKSRYEAHSASTGGPWRTVNEARRVENLAPVDGGDVVLSPLNMTPVGEADTTDEEETT